MRVLSLFDGCAMAYQALKVANISVDKYYASELDTFAIKIAMKNHPDIIQLGDVTQVSGDMIDGPIDLLIGGSPCQDLSIAKKGRKGLHGERSGLFWEYIRLLKELKPRRFVLENVASMSRDSMLIITQTIGYYPIMINSALLTAQQRKRYYWTNIPGISEPDDMGILLKDIIEDGFTERDKSLSLTATYSKGGSMRDYEKKQRQLIFTKPINIGNINPSGRGINGNVYSFEGKSPALTTNKGEGIKVANTPIRVGQLGKGGQGDRVYSPTGKSVSLSANGGGMGAKTGLYDMSIIQKGRGFNKGGEHTEKSPTVSCNSRQENNKLKVGEHIRKLTPIECERLQGLPDNYTEGVSNSQRYKMIGNGFTVPVIAHILSHIPDA